ncbi:MAG: preprotein translocase subunit YajC [Acidobacteriota bacterium]
MTPGIAASLAGAAFAQAPSGGGQQPGAFISFLVPMGLILVIFYFLLIRPANRKQKALQHLIDNLKNGDKVITTGGIHGTVAGMTDDLIQLKVAPNLKIEISRSAVASLRQPKER